MFTNIARHMIALAVFLAIAAFIPDITAHAQEATTTGIAPGSDGARTDQAAGHPQKGEAQAESAEDLLVDWLSAPWTGDLDGMVERGFLRVGTTFNPVLFSSDKADQRGTVVDLTNALVERLRKTLGKEARHLTIVISALPRDRLIPALTGGEVDVLMANLTITPARAEVVDFTNPLLTGVREVLVTGPSAPPIGSIDDLAGITLRLRPTSSYYEHLKDLKAARASARKPEIPVEPINENMEDNDILDLVSAGTLPAAIIDGHMAALYAQIIPDLTVHESIAINEGGEIAWAIRKNSPKLMDALNGFVKTASKGTKLGNMLYSRYFKDAKRVKNAMAPKESERFKQHIGMIAKYARQYDFDVVMIAAQAYQESGIDQSKRSAVGAIGIMQVMPSTARDPAIGIPSIEVADNNVQAGVKYLRLLRTAYFDDPAISTLDQTLFAFAAYNAGPGNIAKARKRAAKMGLDPNVWFGNVELATAKAVSREPVVYVRNILKYYVTYQIFADTREKAGG
jgi:membrane-bound lytic murein transglycosylase MltF